MTSHWCSDRMLYVRNTASRHFVAALKETGSFVTSPTSGLCNKQKATVLRYKGRYTLSVKLSDFTV